MWTPCQYSQELYVQEFVFRNIIGILEPSQDIWDPALLSLNNHTLTSDKQKHITCDKI